jgi:hypothetical protein
LKHGDQQVFFSSPAAFVEHRMLTLHTLNLTSILGRSRNIYKLQILERYNFNNTSKKFSKKRCIFCKMYQILVCTLRIEIKLGYSSKDYKFKLQQDLTEMPDNQGWPRFSLLFTSSKHLRI